MDYCGNQILITIIRMDSRTGLIVVTKYFINERKQSHEN